MVVKLLSNFLNKSIVIFCNLKRFILVLCERLNVIHDELNENKTEPTSTFAPFMSTFSFVVS